MIAYFGINLLKNRIKNIMIKSFSTIFVKTQITNAYMYIYILLSWKRNLLCVYDYKIIREKKMFFLFFLQIERELF